jgi:hypothetical protein
MLEETGKYFQCSSQLRRHLASANSISRLKLAQSKFAKDLGDFIIVNDIVNDYTLSA